MKIGIICAMQVELELLKEELKECKESSVMGFPFYEGRLHDRDVILSLSGMGKVNAAIGTALLINNFKVDLIINSGISGGTKPLKRRDSVLATYLYYSDVDATIFGYAYGQVPGMPVEFAIKEELINKVEQAFKTLKLPYVKTKVVTGDQFITSMDQLKNCREKDGVATDMEGAAIAQAAYNARVDLIILKYVSDVIGEENQAEEYYKFEAEMAHKSASVTLEFLKILDK